MKSYEELKTSHPCFAQGEKPNKGRVHLPVSPGCNISCNFCKRSINDYDFRPGVSSGIVTPQEAVEILRKAVLLCPDITVAGVAGPGDALATPFALQTFRLVKQEFPGIIKCMSTNGFALPEHIGEIAEIGIDSLSVTVNAVDEDILSNIVSGVDPGQLIHNQLTGIKAAAETGITVKVNTVLIPEINAEHIADIAKKVSELGAKFYNIIPLIPQHKLHWCTAPDCGLISKTRKQCEQYISVFRHCRRCRADAAGILGGVDVSKELYIRPMLSESTFSHG